MSEEIEAKLGHLAKRDVENELRKRAFALRGFKSQLILDLDKMLAPDDYDAEIDAIIGRLQSTKYAQPEIEKTPRKRSKTTEE